MSRVRLSAAEARRIALAAQGFDRLRPSARPDRRHFRRALRATGLLQLDYVNVLLPAHYLVLWSRLGPYERDRFDRFSNTSGELTEQWAHEASLVPTAFWPLLEHRRKEYRIRDYNPLRRLPGRQAYLDNVLRQVASEGPLTAQDLPPLPGPTRKAGDWHRSLRRWALEYHFGRGTLAVAGRLPNFQRVFDLPDRVIPEEHIARRVDREEAESELLRFAARSLGVATLQDLADYFRMSPRIVAPRLQDLVDDGVVYPVQVEGWKQPAFMASGTRLPRFIEGHSLLSPFDPLLWFRPRAERLFDFHYRLEIYVPAGKRRWGYYVLPFRLGDRIAARVDLKADRKSCQLLVLASYIEDGVSRSACAEALAKELRSLGNWLGLASVRIVRHNGFSRQLAAVL